MRPPWWDWGLWVYRSVTTQANGAGGAISVDFEPSMGDEMILVWLTATNSGTNSLRVRMYDEDNATAVQYASIASGAGTLVHLPASGDPASATDNVADSRWIAVRGDNFISIEQSGAGAQNDTLLISQGWYLSNDTLPVASKARSTNQSDVTIATPTVNKVI